MIICDSKIQCIRIKKYKTKLTIYRENPKSENLKLQKRLDFISQFLINKMNLLF